MTNTQKNYASDCTTTSTKKRRLTQKSNKENSEAGVSAYSLQSLFTETRAAPFPLAAILTHSPVHADLEEVLNLVPTVELQAKLAMSTSSSISPYPPMSDQEFYSVLQDDSNAIKEKNTEQAAPETAPQIENEPFDQESKEEFSKISALIDRLIKTIRKPLIVRNLTRVKQDKDFMMILKKSRIPELTPVSKTINALHQAFTSESPPNFRKSFIVNPDKWLFINGNTINFLLRSLKTDNGAIERDFEKNYRQYALFNIKEIEERIERIQKST